MSEKISIPIVIVAGPTGAGKSGVALRLAEAHNAEIVNMDAFQIYRGMRIGTAQPSDEERARAKHWLYDFHSPEEAMSAAAYARLADQAIEEIHQRGKRVLLVGGAGFYMRSLLLGLFESPAVDISLRNGLNARAAVLGGKQELYQELQKVDPATAARLPVNDVYRVVRALEIFYQTGRPLSVHHQEHNRVPRYPYKLIALSPAKDELSKKQKLRVQAMFEGGWGDEVNGLIKIGISVDSPGFRAIGYRTVADWVSGKISKEAAISLVETEHQQYAKRQRTWLRGEAGAEYFSFGGESGIEEVAVRGWG